MNMSGAEGGEKFDLAERTARFGEAVVRFVRPIKRTDETRVLIRQLVRAGTSIGANYLEADEAGSKKEFRYRISLCKRETKETRYWLRMLVCAAPSSRDTSPGRPSCWTAPWARLSSVDGRVGCAWAGQGP